VAAPQDWTWWRGPQNTGVAIGSTITSANVSSLTLAWKANLGSAAYGTPAVSQNVVVASATNTVAAFNASTGAQLWSFASPEGYVGFSGPTIIGNTVFVSTQWNGAATYALNLTTGKVIWDHNWTTNFSSYGAAFPVNANEIIIGLGNQSEPPCAHGAIIALNTADGSMLWEHDTAAQGNGSGVWAAANADASGNIVVTTGNDCTQPPPTTDEPDSILSLNASTGTERWRFFALDSQNDPANTDLDFGSTPVYADGTVVAVSKSGRVYGVSATTGTKVFETQITPAACCPDQGGSISSPAWDGTRLYLGGGDQGGTGAGRFVAMSLTGSVLWNFASTKPVTTPPTVANDVVFLGDASNIAALSTASGTELWQYQTGNLIWGGAAVVGNAAYTTSTDGYLYAFALPK
jgi:outer membrane protein assembly factor BamB